MCVEDEPVNINPGCWVEVEVKHSKRGVLRFIAHKGFTEDQIACLWNIQDSKDIRILLQVDPSLILN